MLLDDYQKEVKTKSSYFNMGFFIAQTESFTAGIGIYSEEEKLAVAGALLRQLTTLISTQNLTLDSVAQNSLK